MRYPETRPSLIVRLKGQGNEPAWEEFVRAYEPFLNSVVSRRGVPARHVPDVTQQILAAIARSVEQWNNDGQPASFRRWLTRVSRNIVVRYMAKERRMPGGAGGTEWLAQLHEIASEPDETQLQAYDFELIVWAAEQVRSEFKPTSWSAFWSTLVEGRSVEDVSQQLGVSPGSIYMSRSRIIARIRAKVREAEEGSNCQ